MDEFEYKGFKYRIVSVVDATVELIYAGELTGKIVVPEEVEYQNQKCKVVAIRGAKKIEYYDYQPDDKRRKVERRSREVFCPVFVGQSLQSFQDKLEVVLPKSLKKIGDYAFYECYNLVSVNIPVGVTSIGDYIFTGCHWLTSITIPNSVTSIGKGAFRTCVALTSITIPNSVTSIGEDAFSLCFKLTSITIPNSVTSIGKGAFSNCGLTSITIENEEGKVVIGKEALPYNAKITYVGKPKEQPAKPAEKEIAQAKPEAPKATTQANPGVVIDLEKLMAAALIDGVVTDKERAILIKKVKEAGGDVDEFEMLLDARIYEAQQKQAQQQPVQPQAPAQSAPKAAQPTIAAAPAASNPVPAAEKTQHGREAWQDNKWLPIVDQIINALDFVKNGQYAANYGAKGYIGFADTNGKARNFTIFFPKKKELRIEFWWIPQNQEYEAWFAAADLPCEFEQNTRGQYWYSTSINSESLSEAQLTLIDKMIYISLKNFNGK